MGGGFEGFYHGFGWCFCCFLQNCTVLQFLKFSRLLLLEPTKGWAVQRRKDLYSLQNLLCDVVNTNLILGNIWLKGYTWLNVSIFQGTHEKSPLWEWKKLPIWYFSDLIKFKSQEQTRKLFGSSCIIVNYHNKKNPQKPDSHSVSENSLKFAFGKNAPCAVMVRSIDSSWLLSMDWYITFLCCKHISFLMCAYPKQVLFATILKGNRYFPEESVVFGLPPNYSFTIEK